MKTIPSVETIPLDSTRLCCNFVNTVYAWKGENHTEFLVDYSAFIDWCARVNIYDNDTLAKLRNKAHAEPAAAMAAMEKIWFIRQFIHDFIAAIANHDEKKVSGLSAEINLLMTDALSHTTLEFSDKGFTLSYKLEPANLISPVWMILKSLYDLLADDEVPRIKECGTCGWVFYDETKNGKRRWCNPVNCGTKDKMSRYHTKLKEGKKD